MAVNFFMDWCPRATNSVEPVARDYIHVGDNDQLSDIVIYAANRRLPKNLFKQNIQSLNFAYRTDGLFVFQINWTETAGTLEAWTKINIASIISHYFKEQLGHLHRYNDDHASVIRDSEWQPLHSYPVILELSKEQLATDKLMELIASNDKLLALNCQSPPIGLGNANHNDSGPSMRAILRLREKRSRMFDRSMNWIFSIKTTRFAGFPIYGRPLVYIITYLIFVLCWLIHELSDRPDHYPGNLQTLVAGGIAGYSLLAGIIFLRAQSKKLFSWVEDWFPNLMKGILNSRTYLWFWYRFSRPPRFVPSYADMMFVLIITSPILFSIKEIPDFLGLLKFFRMELTENIFKSTDQYINIISAESAFSKQHFWKQYVGEVIYFLPVVLIMYYTLDISSKRRKILKCLGNLRGHLIYANIFDSVVHNIFRDLHKVGSKYFGFNDVIRLVDDRMRLERRKRIQVQSILALAFFVSIATWFDRYSTLLGGFFE